MRERGQSWWRSTLTSELVYRAEKMTASAFWKETIKQYRLTIKGAGGIIDWLGRSRTGRLIS